ncbi:hypothetical protein LA080_014009 [Diaporthe eres]|nr:hypothetical protein LA080_014009 [Diaporthe eres]
MWLRDTPGELLPSYEVIPTLNPQLNVGATVSMFARLRREYQAGGSLGANIPFDLSAQCNATDTKDCVYGCLGFLSQQASSGFEVDYRKSAHEIYHEATTAAFRHNPVEFLGPSIINLRFWPSYESARLDEAVINSLDSGASDPLDLPNDVNHILEPDSERLSIHIRGIQDAMTMFQKTLSQKTALDGPAHAVVEIKSMEDFFWLFVPRGQFFGQEIIPELRDVGGSYETLSTWRWTRELAKWHLLPKLAAWASLFQSLK